MEEFFSSFLRRAGMPASAGLSCSLQCEYVCMQCIIMYVCLCCTCCHLWWIKIKTYINMGKWSPKSI